MHRTRLVSFFQSQPWRRVLAGAALAALAAGGCNSSGETVKPASTPVAPAPPTLAPGMQYHLPTDAELPQDPSGAAVRRGLQIVTRTYETLPDHTPSGLHCTSCHLEGGTKANASPWLGIESQYPAYRARSGKVDSIEDRINDCFERSLNGKPLDPTSSDMAAIIAYMRFISRDVPPGATPGRGFARIQPEAAPDRARGELLYKQQCSACHGTDGQGQSPAGQYVFPALAGARSFNLGAGMARLNTAAAFIHANMPLGQGGTLTVQQAYDVADYVIRLERPGFERATHDWPKGDKPSDARY